MRNLVLTAVIALTALSCELAARALFDPRGFRSRHEERLAFVGRIPLHGPRGNDSRDDFASALERINGSMFDLHPFFGYTHRRSFEGANAQGFYSGGPSFPYRAAPGELVVGIFGGSVAAQVAGAHQRIEATLLPMARAHGFDRVTVLSFAVGGWRQPQHFNAMVRFLDSIDIAVVVDGFNEVIHLGDWHLARQPAEFPWSAVYAVLARQPSAAETLQRADLIRAHATAARVTRVLDAPLVRSSALAHLAWRVYAARYEQRVAPARDALAQIPSVGEPASAPTATEIAERRSAYLDWWQDLTLYSDLISHARGRLFFHFIQPNQYARGSKPLSPEERERFTRNTAWFEEVTPRYARVKDMTARLRRQGVDSTFLGDMFAGTEETLYVDDCCHLNEHGVDMLATAVAKHIVTSDQLTRLRSLDLAHAGS